MKLKDFLGKVIENKNNKQINVSFKKGKMKKYKISTHDLLNMKVDLLED